jgi:hypothetical protein
LRINGNVSDIASLKFFVARPGMVSAVPSRTSGSTAAPAPTPADCCSPSVFLPFAHVARHDKRGQVRLRDCGAVRHQQHTSAAPGPRRDQVEHELLRPAVQLAGRLIGEKHVGTVAQGHPGASPGESPPESSRSTAVPRSARPTCASKRPGAIGLPARSWTSGCSRRRMRATSMHLEMPQASAAMT